MDSVLQLIVSQLSGDALGQISERVGIDEQQAQKAVGVALPILIGALNRNTADSDGAQALAGALDSDHDGSILDNLSTAVTRDEVVDEGTAILGHVLGEQRSNIVNRVSSSTSLEPDQVDQILAILAPILMGALGQMKRKKDLDEQGVSELLQEERKTVEQTSSGLIQLLDMDQDGDVTEEVVSLGANFLGGLFGSKK